MTRESRTPGGISPPDVVAAAQERGRAGDLDATVAELLAEFGERAPQTIEIHDDERADA